MQALTRRGWFVLGVAAALAVWGLVSVSASLWWVGVDSPKAEFWGWCWGSMLECVNY